MDSSLNRQQNNIKKGIKQEQIEKQQFTVYRDQVSGKTPKFTDKSGQYLFKKVSKKQENFYRYIQTVNNYTGNHWISKYIPQYIGTFNIDLTQTENKQKVAPITDKRDQWLHHIASRNQSQHTKIKHQTQDTTYIKMKNITYRYKNPCIMDIKLGRKSSKKSNTQKYKQSTTDSHHFRINGMSKLGQNGEYFISKYYFQKVNEAQIEKHLAFFFYDGQKIDIQLLNKAIVQIKQLILALLTFTAGKFNSSSLLLSYDANNHDNFAVKFIDFDQYSQSNEFIPDHNIIQGIKNALEYLISIQTNKEIHQKLIQNKQLQLFKQTQVVPERIIKKYNKKHQQNQ